jgi:hypothetical protein
MQLLNGNANANWIKKLAVWAYIDLIPTFGFYEASSSSLRLE